MPPRIGSELRRSRRERCISHAVCEGVTSVSCSEAPTTRRKRILFVAEAVTLAHAARPVCLARSLDPQRYEIVLAWDPRYKHLFGELSFPTRVIRSVATENFLGNLARGNPVYDVATLRTYVREDLEILAQTRPDLVIGDFRLSLAVSAELAGVPYASISNVYWSPYAEQGYPVPDLPMTRVLGLRMAQILFDWARPLAFAYHARPLNRVRREHGLIAFAPDVRSAYTHADYTLYADLPGLVSTSQLPKSHRYLGPIVWSPKVSLPPWWDDVPDDRPIVYVTLGSSGRSDLLPVVLDALGKQPVSVIVATAGRVRATSAPSSVFVADYLPGSEAAARSQLVICNGGSLATYQAFAHGVPVLGITGNLDQLLNMNAVTLAGAGISLRASQLTGELLCSRVAEMLQNPVYTARARELAKVVASSSAQERFAAFVDGVCGQCRPRQSIPTASGRERAMS